MYFATLRELEMLLRGHEAAFEQLHVIDRDQGFHASFGDWLYRRKRVSTSGGWSSAIDLLASTAADHPEAVFSRVVREFLVEWASVVARHGQEGPHDPDR